MSDWTAQLVEGVRRDWCAGMSASVIAGRRGLTKNQVIGKIHRLGLPERPTSHRCGSLSIAPAIIKEIRRRYAAGERISTIMAACGVSLSSVRRHTAGLPRRSRPIGHMAHLAASVPAAVLAAINGVAAARGMSRSAVVAELLQSALSGGGERAAA